MSLLTKAEPFENRWPQWKPLVVKLLQQEPVTRQEWQELFWDVHSVVSWEADGAEKILDAVAAEIAAHVRMSLDRILMQQGSFALLAAYRREWEQFHTQSNYLPHPFRPVGAAMIHSTTGQIVVSAGQQNRNENSNDNPIACMQAKMFLYWKTLLFESLMERLQAGAMAMIRDERNGEIIDVPLVIAVKDSFVCMDEDMIKGRATVGGGETYRMCYEALYFEETRSCYECRAGQYRMENGIYSYVKYATEKYNEELDRGQRYLETKGDSTSLELLKTCLVSCLILSVVEPIKQEFSVVLSTGSIHHARAMFELLNLVPNGIAGPKAILDRHIVESGIQDMKEHADSIVTDPEKYVQRLISLFNQYTDLIRLAFDSDSRMLTVRDMAFRKVINDTSVFSLDLDKAKKPGQMTRSPPESRCPELLANYCDQLLRKTPLSRKLMPEEIDERLKGVILLLKYVQNTDVFMRFHQTHLMRRLISETSTDNDREESVVQWLQRSGMATEYIHKFQRMFQDMNVCETFNGDFKEHLRGKDLSKLASMMNVKILNQSAWVRNSERTPVSLPIELEEFVPETEEFYHHQHNGRRIVWHHNLSSGIITMSSDIGTYDLEVTSFQMAILFAWNQRPRESISLNDLSLATELVDVDLRRTLWSLVSNARLKRQLLLVTPPVKSPRDLTAESLFSINHQFAVVRNNDVQKRGKISFLGKLQLMTEKVREEVGEGIVALRVLRLQEAIVRILKMRKQIDNSKLYLELIGMLKNMFVPTKRMVKEQIEWLIDQGYMKRDEKAIDNFIYVA